MKNKRSGFFFASVIASFALVDHAVATTTLTFSSGAVARMSGFGNSAGVATDGLRYGMVIDTAGDGFDNSIPGTTYDFIDQNVSGFISTTNGGLSSITDDYFFVPATFPVTASSTAVTAAGETGSQVSTITSLANAPNGTDGIIPGVTTGDRFAIIWFDTVPAAEGSYYGLYSIPQFVLPASGTTASFASNFTGNDAVKTAGLRFTNVPEPSRVMLFALGAMGMIVRRRRS